MQLGIHFVNFTLPGGPASLAGTLAETARIADDGGVSTFTLMDHWFQMEMMAPATDPMLEGYTTLGFLAGQHPPHAPRAAGHRRHVPSPRSARQDRHHPRRALGWARPARHRRRLVRARAPRPRCAVPAVGRDGSSASRRPCRSACRCGATTTAPTTARHYQLAETICSPAPISSPHPPHPHRRWR